MKSKLIIAGVSLVGAYYVYVKYAQYTGKVGNYNVGGQLVSATCSFTDYLFGRCANVVSS